MKTIIKINHRIAAFLLVVFCVLISCPSETGTNEHDPILPEEGQPGTGVSLKKETLTLTIKAKEKLAYTIAPEVPNKSVTWTSSNPSIVNVSSDGTVTALNFGSGGGNRYNSGGTTTNPTSTPAIGTATITVKTTDSKYSDTITINTTTAGQEDILSLPPLKDLFADYFLIGNILRDSSEISGTGSNAIINNNQLTRHFNALTAENHMKPGNLISGHNNGTFTWSANNQTTVNNFISAAQNSNIKVIGHTLLWHSQNPNWVWEQISTRGNGKNPGGTGTNPGPGVAIATEEQALTIMKNYISTVAGYYKGKIYSWDVLNEIFPDNATRSNADSWKTQMRNGKAGEGQDGNPWFVAIGEDFVYEGFLAARKADPNAILYYNDYNTDNSTRAQLIRDMVKEVNDKYLTSSNKPAGEPPGRLLIEGIGMQEHHNFSVSASAIKATINIFKTLNVAGRDKIKLSVSELDVIAYDQYSGLTNAGGAGANQNHNSLSTNLQLVTQSTHYDEYMKVYIENADIIERVSLWGVTDNTSWRSRGLPLLFDHAGKAKPAYYSFTGAF